MSSPLLGDRLKAAIVALVRELDPLRDYDGFHEYRVISGNGATGYDLQPVSSSSPALQGVKAFGGNSATTLLLPGSPVVVFFVRRDPPLVPQAYIGFDSAIVRHGDLLGAVTLGAYVAQKVPPP